MTVIDINEVTKLTLNKIKEVVNGDKIRNNGFKYYEALEFYLDPKGILTITGCSNYDERHKKEWGTRVDVMKNFTKSEQVEIKTILDFYRTMTGDSLCAEIHISRLNIDIVKPVIDRPVCLDGLDKLGFLNLHSTRHRDMVSHIESIIRDNKGNGLSRKPLWFVVVTKGVPFVFIATDYKLMEEKFTGKEDITKDFSIEELNEILNFYNVYSKSVSEGDVAMLMSNARYRPAKIKVKSLDEQYPEGYLELQ